MKTHALLLTASAGSLVFALGFAGAACDDGTTTPKFDAGALPADAARDGSSSTDGSARLDGALASDADPESDGGIPGFDGAFPELDGQAGDSGTSDADLSDAPIDFGLCDPTATWKASIKIASSGLTDDWMGSITEDELTIAWTSGDATSSVVHYADRAATTDPFGATQSVTGAFAFDRAALSPDGLRLTVVNADRKGFTEVTRTQRTDAFAAAGVNAYANVNDYGANTMPAAELYGDPLIASSNRRLYYSRFGGGRTDTVFASTRIFPADAWDPGVSLTGAPEIVAVGATRKRPTGLSSDSRAFFFWDETAATERVAWYVAGSYAFAKVVDLGARQFAQPNAACDRLYYSAPGENGVDLFSADRN